MTVAWVFIGTPLCHRHKQPAKFDWGELRFEFCLGSENFAWGNAWSALEDNLFEDVGDGF